jgi:hypothetical protein
MEQLMLAEAQVLNQVQIFQVAMAAEVLGLQMELLELVQLTQHKILAVVAVVDVITHLLLAMAAQVLLSFAT